MLTKRLCAPFEGSRRKVYEACLGETPGGQVNFFFSRFMLGDESMRFWKISFFRTSFELAFGCVCFQNSFTLLPLSWGK